MSTGRATQESERLEYVAKKARNGDEEAIEHLIAEVERLRGALEWYADESRYFFPEGAHTRYQTEAEEDNGERAREALGR